MQLFYNQHLTPDDVEIRFSKEESRHIVKVLRKSIGDRLNITNGNGWLFSADIITADIKNCIARITDAKQQPQKDYHLHLAVAPTKMNDRYEWFLEKATEIGIDTISPIICDNSERRVIKADRYEKILQSAMKQSLHCYLPNLKNTIAFKEFVSQEFKGQKFIAHCEEGQRSSLKEVLVPREDATILIGPEGDFSPSEIKEAFAQGFKPITLGNTRLRTETAAIVACHSVVFVNE